MINIFKRKKKAKKDIFEQGNFNINHIDLTSKKETEFMVSLMYANDMVNTIYPACASCYGISEEKNKTREERIEYIGRRVKTHHTSILEHSNVIIQAFIPLEELHTVSYVATKHNKHVKLELSDIGVTDQNIMSMILEVTDLCRYLSTVNDIIYDKDRTPIVRITFGGSVRGFRYIFENIENRQNKLFISIFNVLKLVVPSSFFIDFINDKVMNDYETIEITEKLLKNCPQRELNNIESDSLDIINMDELSDISYMLKLDNIEKCFDFVSITVNFKKMSRIITQQLTRHRNGITQESQRYVNYSDAPFNSPAKFKDKYDPGKKYGTPIGEFNLEELGNILLTVYEYLVSQGIEKEDARGYLPQNVQCGKVFMTFNLRTLFVFLNLRLDSHAQAEIRLYAEKLADMTQMYANHMLINDMHLASSVYSLPMYKRMETYNTYASIDEEV